MTSANPESAITHRNSRHFVNKATLLPYSVTIYHRLQFTSSHIISDSTFTLLSIFSPLETSGIKIWETINTVLAREMISSDCRPQLKNALVTLMDSGLRQNSYVNKRIKNDQLASRLFCLLQTNRPISHCSEYVTKVASYCLSLVLLKAERDKNTGRLKLTSQRRKLYPKGHF